MTMFEPAQDSARVIAPPPLIGLGALLIGLTLDRVLPAHVVTTVLPLWAQLVLGAVLVMGGFALMQIAKRAFQHLGTEVKPWLPSTQIVASGPYRYLRNPMYVAGVLVIAGLALALASDWTLAMLVPLSFTTAWCCAKNSIWKGNSATLIVSIAKPSPATAGRLPRSASNRPSTHV
jgi:protein-S-isoprenylcysteine O-methyltransferase Ste14